MKKFSMIDCLLYWLASYSTRELLVEKMNISDSASGTDIHSVSENAFVVLALFP